MKRQKGASEDSARAMRVPKKESRGDRTLFMLLISLLCCLAAAVGLTIGLSAGFGTLFRTWGVDSSSVARAPAWALWLYYGSGSLVSLAIGAVWIAICRVLRRKWLGDTELVGQPRPRAFALCALGGLAVAALPVIVFLLADRLRLDGTHGGRLSVSSWIWLASTLIILLGEECLTKRLVYDGVRAGWGRAWAAAIATVVFFAVNTGWAGNIASGANVLMMALITVQLYDRGGLWASVGARWGWSVGTSMLFGGGSLALLRTYGVSETWLTGGDAGAAFGWGATLLLAACLAFMNRHLLAESVSRRRHREEKRG